MRLIKASIVVAVFVVLSQQQALAEQVKLCIGPSIHAPYKWLENGQAKGALVELMDEIFQRIDLSYSLDILPWKRCQVEVEEYDQLHRYEIFINGLYTNKRDKKYLKTAATHYTKWGLFYSEYFHPTGLDLSDLSRLGKKYTPCVKRGEPPLSEFGITSYDAVFANRLTRLLQMIAMGRCDFLVTSDEMRLGFAITNQSFPRGVVSADLTGIDMPVRPYYAMWVSRSSPRGERLQTQINQAIKDIKADGTYDKIFQPYWLKMNAEYTPIQSLETDL